MIHHALWGAAVLVLLFSTLVPVPAFAGEPAAGDVIPGRYIVTLHDASHPRQVAAEYHSRAGGRVEHVYETVLNGFAGELSHAELRRAQNDPRVAAVEPDRVVGIANAQVDPPSWGLDRIDQHDRPLDDSYRYARTGQGVIVYVLDTGIRDTHEDFDGRVEPGHTVINDGHGTSDCGSGGSGHGTHVAGTIGGSDHGVAKEVTLIPARVLGCDGTGTSTGVIAGIDWVTGQHNTHGGPSVANMSLGLRTEGGAPATSDALDNAIRDSISAGVTYTLAAGNSDADACTGSPSRVAEGLTVGASTSTDAKSSFSNYGSCVDLFAPGSGITSTHNTSDTAATPKSGTSMASPHVAGVAALYLERNPEASPAEVHEKVRATATNGVLKTTGMGAIGTGSPNLLTHSLFGADLFVDKTGPEEVRPGDPLPWTVAVTNYGPIAGASLVLTDVLPEDTAFSSASPGCDEAPEGTVTCDLGDLGVDELVEIEIVTAWAPVDTPTTVTNTATVADASGSATALLLSARADLDLEAVGPDVAFVGETAEYTFSVANAGPDTATAATVTLPMPDEAALDTGASSEDCAVEAGTLACQLPDIVEGDSAVAAVVLLPQAPGTWELEVTAAAAPWSATDATATLTTTVHRGTADLSVAVEAVTSTVLDSDVTYAISVVNEAGPDTATGVQASLELPSGLTFVSGPGCNATDGTVTCTDLPDLAEAEDATVDVVLHASATGEWTTEISASSEAFDPTPATTAHTLTVSSPTSGGGGGGGFGGGGGGEPEPEPEPSPSPSPSPSPTPIVTGTVSVEAEAGETVSTGTHTDADTPAQVAVTTPNAGTVTITLDGLRIEIDAPPATADDPLVLRFRLDEAALDGGAAVTVLRNGIAVPDCPGSARAEPDPCVSARFVSGGQIHLTVLTSQASVWTFTPPETVDCTNPPPAGFTDTDPNSVHARAIDCLVALGVARGTTATTYEPAQHVTRGQMATFIVGALEAAGVTVPTGSSGFTDTVTSVHRERIDQLVATGITQGTTATTYEPLAPVTRAQMATFLVRAHEYVTGTPLPAATTSFDDIATSVHRDNIERAAGAGLVAGRTATTYDPAAAVRRDQMATFLVRLLEAL